MKKTISPKKNKRKLGPIGGSSCIAIRRHRFTIETIDEIIYDATDNHSVDDNDYICHFVKSFEYDTNGKTIHIEAYDFAYVGCSGTASEADGTWEWMQMLSRKGILRLKTYNDFGKVIYQMDFTISMPSISIKQKFDYAPVDTMQTFQAAMKYTDISKQYIFEQ